MENLACSEFVPQKARCTMGVKSKANTEVQQKPIKVHLETFFWTAWHIKLTRQKE